MNTGFYLRCQDHCKRITDLVDEKSQSLKCDPDLVEAICNTFLALQNLIQKQSLPSPPRLTNPLIPGLKSPDTKWTNLYSVLVRKIQSIRILQIESVDVTELRSLMIGIFIEMEELHVNMCPPSTIFGLSSLRHKLKVLSISKIYN